MNLFMLNSYETRTGAVIKRKQEDHAQKIKKEAVQQEDQKL